MATSAAILTGVGASSHAPAQQALSHLRIGEAQSANVFLLHQWLTECNRFMYGHVRSRLPILPGSLVGIDFALFPLRSLDHA